MPQAQSVTPETSRRQLVIVSGAGRSGTSTVAGALSKLGFTVPKPEVEANRSNPRGFFEPRWVVDFHTRMLKAADSTALDGRPSVQDKLREVAARPGNRTQLHDWLEGQLSTTDLVIKDPRTFWFRDLWHETAIELGTEPTYLTMVRHPAEVVGSRDTYYSGSLSRERRAAQEVANLAGWVNCTLLNELTTRGHRRAFVRYTDLLADWRTCMDQAAKDLGIVYDGDISAGRPHAIDDFIDVKLRRVRVTWSDMVVPGWLQELAESTWQLISGAKGSLTDPQVEAELDQVRGRYERWYADSIALARDHTNAAVRTARRQTRRKVLQEQREKAVLEPEVQRPAVDVQPTSPVANTALETGIRRRGRALLTRLRGGSEA